MNLKNINKEELEILSFTDLTELILKENNKPVNTPTIFKTICDLLDYSDSEYTDKIGDYFTSLTTDKRFVLETNEWDLREKHSVKLVLDEDELEEDEIEEELEEDEIEEEIEEDDIDTPIDDDLDDDVDELDDLAVLSEEELDEE